jgi:S1-C subfamily serine protease
MRRLLALASLASTVVGAVLVLVLGFAFGLIGKPHEHAALPAASASRQVAAPVVTDAGAQALPGTFDARRIYAQRSAGVVTLFSYFGPGNAAQGSGFVISVDGTILTDAHVITTAGETSPGQSVQPARSVYVEFSDRDRIAAKVVGWDVFDDVGVLKVDPSQHALSVVPLGSSAAVAVGEPVAAIGSPLGNENSLAVGVVSAIHRSIPSLTSRYQLVDAIQTDAAITHGNSGGPLLDAAGRAIGINAQIRSQSGTGNDAGVGFAVPIDSARRSVQQLLHGGRVRYAYVGLTSEDLTPSLARHLGLAVSAGALVDTVSPGGPADRAGIHGGTQNIPFEGSSVVRGGDVIVAIGGMPVTSADDLVRIVTTRLDPGRVVRFTLVRGGKRRTVGVRLADRPANPHVP